MGIKPILFNTEMVKAIMEGRKTQTRRILKPCYKGKPYPIWEFPDRIIPEKTVSESEWWQLWLDKVGNPYTCVKMPCKVDDVLWVRETWCRIGNHKAGRPMHYCYKADMEDPSKDDYGFHAIWRPSIHMPKEAARLFLRVKAVRVERLQDMKAQDSLDEGVKLHLKEIVDGADPLLPFAKLWNSTINKGDFSKYCWSANPWVWVIEFERMEATQWD